MQFSRFACRALLAAPFLPRPSCRALLAARFVSNRALILSSLILVTMLLCSPAARASHWKVSVTDTGGSQTTSILTGSDNENYTIPWTPPADGSNTTSFGLDVSTYIDTPDTSGSCSATVNAKITLTWVADPVDDPAPPNVWIVETASASASATGAGATSTANDGLPGDIYLKDPPAYPSYDRDSGSMVTPPSLPGGGRLTKLPVSGGSASFNRALSASSSSSDSPVDYFQDADLADLSYTLNIHATPYNFHKVAGKGSINTDGSLTFVYDWNSTTGNKDDLTTCFWHEYVTYPGTVGTIASPNPYYPPDPPFNFPTGVTWLNNPEVGPGSGKQGGPMTGTYQVTDNQLVPPLVDPPLYTYGTYTATQVYQYDDTATGESNVPIPGPDSGPFSIVREFKYYDLNNYQYTVTKDGKMSFVLKPLH